MHRTALRSSSIAFMHFGVAGTVAARIKLSLSHAGSYAPSQHLAALGFAIVSFQHDRLRVPNLLKWSFEREIATLREPDASFVVAH